MQLGWCVCSPDARPSCTKQACTQANLTVVKSPVTAAEAIKNQVEIEGFKAAYRRDGAAWVRWAAWLEEAMKAGEQISEWDAAEKLTAYRKSGESFAGVSGCNKSPYVGVLTTLSAACVRQHLGNGTERG